MLAGVLSTLAMSGIVLQTLCCCGWCDFVHDAGAGAGAGSGAVAVAAGAGADAAADGFGAPIAHALCLMCLLRWGV